MEENFTLDGDLARVEDEVLDIQHIAVVGHDDGDNGHAGLDGEVEGALLEREQRGIFRVAPGSLGEHVDALSLGLNLLRSALHGIARILAILAIQKDGPAQRHEPSQERRLLQRRLGRDAAILGEDGAEHEHIQLGLVVANEDGGPRGAENILGILHVKGDADGEAHEVVKGAPGGPLRNLLLAGEGEGDGGEDAVEGDEDERDVAGEDAGDKGGLGDERGQAVEEEDDGGVDEEEIVDVGEERHGGRFLKGLFPVEGERKISSEGLKGEMAGGREKSGFPNPNLLVLSEVSVYFKCGRRRKAAGSPTASARRDSLSTIKRYDMRKS